MKVLSFTIPASQDKTILVQEDILPSFYPFLHRHEEIQLTMIIKGEGTLVVGKNMHAFTKNQIFLIGANMPHVFKDDEVLLEDGSENGIHALTIFFNPKGKLANFFDLPEIKNVSAFFDNNSSGFQIPPERFEEFSGRMLYIKDAGGIDQLIAFFQLLQSISSLEIFFHLQPILNLKISVIKKVCGSVQFIITLCSIIIVRSHWKKLPPLHS